MADNADSPPSPSPPPPLTIDGSDRDAVLAKADYLSRREVLERRSRHCKQLAKLYREHYWVIMDMVKHKHRDYYWTYGKSPFKDDNPNSNSANSNEDNGNGKLGLGLDGGDEIKRCQVAGCKSKAMALTRFCHVHILSDPKQKLYKGCTYVLKREMLDGSLIGDHVKHTDLAVYVCLDAGQHAKLDFELLEKIREDFVKKSSTRHHCMQTGPLLCNKPILRSTVPSLCPTHYQKGEKYLVRDLKKAGLNVSSVSKLAPKFHIIVAEYISQIQTKRRAAQKAIVGKVEPM
ncbi:hypothetical protein FEM48_Zijuj07G0018100 [Ziziphus jujuba var. spinosa]|uniref:KANL2-like probable zinc-finger domain-containing protein n=1 Tax=Ziziphus jujuba var. spinosa TaxID=714518 RepID=A0A978V1R5_ZIZJJ|nr:hypothetical protein FEM48_Zijuj07G0018100 [Ziziphus jujuba var. spinosa]